MLEVGGAGNPDSAAALLETAQTATPARMAYERAKQRAAQGELDAAIDGYEAAIDFAPDFFEAHSNLGTLYLQRGRRAEALRAFEIATRIEPEIAPLHCNLAAALIELGRCDDAIIALETALRLAPDLHEAHANLARAYRRAGREREALEWTLRALDLRPDRGAYVDLGAAAVHHDANDIALTAFTRALAFDPTCAKTHCNVGVVHHCAGRYAEAIGAFEAAIALLPNFALAHFNLGLALLVRGEFARGWREYVWSWRIPALRRHYSYLDRVPLWNGESFAGRRLVLSLDQGFGDTIQMLRYLPAVKARGGWVVLEIKAPLLPLCLDLAGVDELRIVSDGAPPAEADLHVPLLGLPAILGIHAIAAIPNVVPYLRPQSERIERWRPRLQRAARLRVGIVWAGDPVHGNDRRRSTRLEDFAALAGVDDIAWFGLQKGRDEERSACGSFALDPLGAEIEDFGDSAAIVAQLDLVIAVDTSIVHLAGALGTPVWTLLPYAPDWRWLLEREDSPWYPTMRLFRQPAPGDWASVFAQVARELRAFSGRGSTSDSSPIVPAQYSLVSRREIALRECEATLRATAPRADRDACVALGAVAYELDAFDLAAEAYRRALELDAACAAARCNLGWIQHVTGRHAAAIASFEAAIAVQPDFALAHFNLGLSLLVSGDFRRGWDHYAWLRRLPAARPYYPYLDRVPLWTGESFAGRVLLITVEQGFGDAIQMVRFLPAVKARGGRVILEVHPGLVELFADLSDFDELRVYAKDAPNADGIDVHVPMLDLPRALAIELQSIPAPIPYLCAPRERIARWRPRLHCSARLRVGIAWSGNPAHANDRHRSARLADFARLADVADIAWFGLQKGRDETLRADGSFALDPLGSEIGDFADTAAIIAQLDLVISVDTAIVHLAGALGTPVWTLLPFAPDWRWLLERDDSPWYPTMRLFRQPATGDWASVFAQVASELPAFVASGGPRAQPALRPLAPTPGPDGAAPTGAGIALPDATPARTHYERAKRSAADGDVVAAMSGYCAAVSLAPDFAEAHSNLGTLYLAANRHAEALCAFETAIRHRPDLPALHCNLAAALIAAGRFDEAIATAQTALRLAPDLYEAHANLCRAYERSGREREAIAAALCATDRKPDAAVYLDLGVAAFELDAFELVLEANRRALAVDGAYAAAHANMGAVYHLTGRYAESIDAYTAALALQPQSALAHFSLGLSLLVCGNFARGWDEFVWFWRLPARRAQYSYLDRVPLWGGEPFARRLLIVPDQGFGDAIQMARFLPAVKARGGHVILEVRPPLAALFADLAGVDELRVRDEGAAPADDIDVHIPILGLPRALGVDIDSIPAPVPYLRAQPERLARWHPRLERPGCLRVGIAWAGSPGNENDRRRSVRLDDFAALGDVPGIAWFGLQKGRDDTRRSCGEFTLEPLGAEIADFADTAAIVAQLDLVIAVDTSLVHLAGALGKPVWTLLPFAPDWRWLLERDDSPWYPTMRLFRQPAPGDWAAVFSDVARELHVFAARAPTRLAPEALAADREANIALGASAFDRNEFDVALAAFERVRALDPSCAKTHANLGAVYHMAGRYGEAIDACAAAIALQPDFVAAHVNAALSLLVRGEFARGWDEYVWTWRAPARRAHYTYLDRVPLWSGASFSGRLLLTADQGFGDAIQLARYLPAVKAGGGCVRLEVKAPLAALFADLPGVDEFAVYDDDGAPPADDIDLQLPLSGLPRAFATDLHSIPAGVPYLRAAPERVERWARRLQAPARLRVGIAWAGSATNDNDRRRSASLDDFATWGEIGGIAWFGLQKGRDENKRSCGALRLEPLGADIADFADTAAILTHLDLIISVDTSIVHLAGALGKPVWTLLPFAPDWRWLLARDDSPWYPTMRLFRQPVSGDWVSVAAAVARELRALAAKHSA
jgi:tetratricopeptide (TPR) repeat protein